MGFIDDIKGKNTQIYPIVTIEPATDAGSFIEKFNECIFLSTNNVNLEFVHIYDAANSPFPQGKKHHFAPLLLNLPSIKQSIDIESRNFKISNVRLEVSNYEYNGKRFSDMFSNSSFMNKRCSIQFASPSAKYFSTIYKLWNNTASFYQAHTGNHQGIDSDNDGIIDVQAGTPWGDSGTTYPERNANMTQMVFQGIIRRVRHNDEKVTIELEDVTEKEIHENLPSEILPATDSILEKYRNKPKPMVYGSVEKSPVVLGTNNKIIIDYKEIDGLDDTKTDFAGDSISPFKIELDGKYMGVLPDVDTDLGTFDMNDDDVEPAEGDQVQVEGSTQWELIGNEIALTASPHTIRGILQCKGAFKPRTIELESWENQQNLTDDEVAQMTDNVNINQSLVDIESSFDFDISGQFLQFRMLRLKIFTDINVSDAIVGSDGFASRVRKIRLNNKFLPIPKNLDINYQLMHIYPVDTGIPDLLLGFTSFNNTPYTLSGSGYDLRGLFRFGTTDYSIYDANYVTPTDYDIDIQANFNIEGTAEREYIPSIWMYDVCGAGNQSNNGTYLIDFRVHTNWDDDAINEAASLQLSLEGYFKEIDFNAIADIQKVFTKQFYVDVRGRVNQHSDHPFLATEVIDDYTSLEGIEALIYLYQDFGLDIVSQGVWDIYDTLGVIYSVLSGTGAPANDPAVVNLILQEGYIDSWVNQAQFILEEAGYTFPTKFIQNPIDIIYDILRSELELKPEQIDQESYQEARLEHSDWKFAFTLNKKINSKKLIEDIAKSTKCFPKFRNDGTFGFNTIKDSYRKSDYDSAHLVKGSEIISYSFKRTKPEQIYRQVDVQYNIEYAQDSLSDTTTLKDNGSSDFYGIEQSSDAYLEFESPYIREEQTAENLRDFLAAHYKNDHLIFNLKLPLQYIDLEIGELVKFTELFQGLKAYGIDYRVIDGVGDTEFYPLFMITSITKNLDSVSIECMQLHHLSDEERDSAWDDISFPDSEPFIVEPYLFAPDVVTTEYQETDDSIETNNLYVDFGIGGRPYLTNPNDTFNFLDYDGSDGESSIFMLNEYIQIKNYTDSIIVRLSSVINNYGGFQGIQLATQDNAGGFTFFVDQMVEYEKLQKFSKPEGWQEGDPLPTLEITRVIPVSQTVQSRNGKGIKITEIIENNELYFDNKYDLKDLLEMQ